MALTFRHRLGQADKCSRGWSSPYVSNVAWSPSPISPNDIVWAQPTDRHPAMRTALTLVPDDVSVTASYSLLPHLSHREQIYDWPNPVHRGVLGQRRRVRCDPSTIDCLVLDLQTVGNDRRALVDQR